MSLHVDLQEPHGVFVAYGTSGRSYSFPPPRHKQQQARVKYGIYFAINIDTCT